MPRLHAHMAVMSCTQNSQEVAAATYLCRGHDLVFILVVVSPPTAAVAAATPALVATAPSRSSRTSHVTGTAYLPLRPFPSTPACAADAAAELALGYQTPAAEPSTAKGGIGHLYVIYATVKIHNPRESPTFQLDHTWRFKPTGEPLSVERE